MTKKTNKKSMDTILVMTGDQALAVGSFATAGNSVNVASGQLGVMSYDPNSAVQPIGDYLVAGDDSNEVQAIKLVQGTPASSNTLNADVWEVGDKSHIETGVIRKGNIRSVAVKKYVPGTLGAAAVTNFTAPVNDVEYSMYVKLDSVRLDKEYSTMNDNVVFGSSAPINFTTAGVVNNLDYVLTNVLFDLNSQSRAVTANGLKGRQDYVVFGVKVAGGSGQVIGTVTPSTVLTFQTINGVAQTITSSVPMVSALARLVQDNAQLTATSTIENVNLSTAGAAAKIDALIIVGLPSRTAAIYDNVNQTFTKVLPNPAKGFLTGVDPTVTIANPVEPQNTGTKWAIEDDLRARVQTHTMQVQPHNDWFALGKSYVNTAKNYTSYIIEYFDTESVLTNSLVVSPKRATLLFPAEIPSSFTVNVNNVITRIAASSTPVPTVTSTDAGTGTASAVTVADVEAILTAWLEHARTTGTNFAVLGDAAAGGVYLS
jgi:hypothetical protein